MPTVNFVAVLAATFAAMIIGTIYYLPQSPMGRRWLDLIKAPSVMRPPGTAMATQVVISILMMAALAAIIGISGAKGASAGAMIGFWIWIVVALADASGSNFSGRSWSLWMINQVNYLIMLLVGGAVIGALS